MGCNFSNKTVNSIERKKNDIIKMTDIKNDVQLIKFIKMPNLKTGKFDYKIKGDETTQGALQSCYSAHSNVHPQTIRTAHLGRDSEIKLNTLGNSMRRRTKHDGDSTKNFPMESSASIIMSESHLPNSRKYFDHWSFLEQNPDARLIEITCFGYNYVTAIETKFEVPGEEEIFTFLHQGTMHDRAKKNEMHQQTLSLDQNELIETVN